MQKVFLKAEWRKLVMVNYKVDPELLKPYLPYGTELDFWNGNCYVSLVGFMFLNTKIKDIAIPFHENFEEINLRFYVRRKIGAEWRRGVVFIREIVPRFMISWVANTLYREKYVTRPMRHLWNETDTEKEIIYEWKAGGKQHRFGVIAETISQPLQKNSEEEFITEHYWGYSRYSDAKTNEYQVEHPRWETYKIKKYFIELDVEKAYGKSFIPFFENPPVSVMLAEGSEIIVRNFNRN